MWMYIHYHIEFWIFPTLRFSGFFHIWNRHHSSMAWQPDRTSSSLSEMCHTHIAIYYYILLHKLMHIYIDYKSITYSV